MSVGAGVVLLMLVGVTSLRVAGRLVRIVALAGAAALLIAAALAVSDDAPRPAPAAAPTVTYALPLAAGGFPCRAVDLAYAADAGPSARAVCAPR